MKRQQFPQLVDIFRWCPWDLEVSFITFLIQIHCWANGLNPEPNKSIPTIKTLIRQTLILFQRLRLGVTSEAAQIPARPPPAAPLLPGITN